MDGLSTLLIALYIAVGAHGGTAMDGVAPRYGRGVMERVVAKRGLPERGCYVSSAYYPIGTKLYVWGHNTGVLLTCWVGDVSADKDKARHRAQGKPVEAGFTEAQKLCGLDHMQDPPRKCPITVFYLPGEQE